MFRVVGYKVYYRERLVMRIEPNVSITVHQELEHELNKHTATKRVEQLEMLAEVTTAMIDALPEQTEPPF